MSDDNVTEIDQSKVIDLAIEISLDIAGYIQDWVSEVTDQSLPVERVMASRIALEATDCLFRDLLANEFEGDLAVYNDALPRLGAELYKHLMALEEKPDEPTGLAEVIPLFTS